ncbi:hypothetical protein BRC97_00205 [Halobacteriales archaeon QS_6_71_20]|nr:MAG: hypothetical protein BRC97_00205 [Halobacteriales archaeon QS_6_71_20]
MFGVVAGLLFEPPAIPIDPTVSTGQSVGFFPTRNVFVAGLLVLGGLTFGALTVVTLAFNGFILGYVLSSAGGDIVPSLLLIAPHGVIEFPAFLLAGTAGLVLPHELWRYLDGAGDRLPGTAVLWTTLRLFGLSCLLLAVAAVVEATVTPAVAGA